MCRLVYGSVGFLALYLVIQQRPRTSGHKMHANNGTWLLLAGSAAAGEGPGTEVPQNVLEALKLTCNLVLFGNGMRVRCPCNREVTFRSALSVCRRSCSLCYGLARG